MAVRAFVSVLRQTLLLQPDNSFSSTFPTGAWRGVSLWRVVFPASLHGRTWASLDCRRGILRNLLSNSGVVLPRPGERALAALRTFLCISRGSAGVCSNLLWFGDTTNVLRWRCTPLVTVYSSVPKLYADFGVWFIRTYCGWRTRNELFFVFRGFFWRRTS